MSYFDPYFSSKLGKMYSFDPPFFTLVAFRVDGRCWASLSKTWPSTPPGPALSKKLKKKKKKKKQGVKFVDFSHNPFPWQHAKIDTWRPLWGPELQFSCHHSTTAIYCLNWVPTMPNSIHIFVYTATRLKYGIICCSLIITLHHTTAQIQNTCVLIATTRHCRPEPNHPHGVFIGVKPYNSSSFSARFLYGFPYKFQRAWMVLCSTRHPLDVE